MAGRFTLALLMGTAAAAGLTTVYPCPECDAAYAPANITVTAQHQIVSTCTPKTVTLISSYTQRHAVVTATSCATTASCSSYAWVSTTIPVFNNASRTSTVVTSTDQPVTVWATRYEEPLTTTAPVLKIVSGNCTKTSTPPPPPRTTIDVKRSCNYTAIGPLAVPGYSGSGLCKECGPDHEGAITQRFTVESCRNTQCTTFNETWIATPVTYVAHGRPVTVVTTNIYCPTATPESRIPGYKTITGGYPHKTGGNELPRSSTTSCSTAALKTDAPGYYPNKPGHPGAYPDSTVTSVIVIPGGETTVTATVTSVTGLPADPSADPSADPPFPDPSADPSAEPSADPSADPSGTGAVGFAAPSDFPGSFRVFKRHGSKGPQGEVMKRGGLLFYSH